MSRPVRVVLADDHLLVREGVRTLLEAGDDIEVAASVSDADELLEATERFRPDAVLTDIRMPPGDGLDGIHAALKIRRRHPHIGVVVLSQHLEPAYAVELFSAGSVGLGYLLKERIGQRDELVHALKETARGGSVLDARVVDALVSARSAEDASPIAALVPRERQVLGLMAQGLSNPSIAAELHLSLSSIEKHVNAIFASLGLVAEPTTHRRVTAVLTYLRAVSAS